MGGVKGRSEAGSRDGKVQIRRKELKGEGEVGIADGAAWGVVPVITILSSRQKMSSIFLKLIPPEKMK
jgi:hypothetical protein